MKKFIIPTLTVIAITTGCSSKQPVKPLDKVTYESVVYPFIATERNKLEDIKSLQGLSKEMSILYSDGTTQHTRFEKAPNLEFLKEHCKVSLTNYDVEPYKYDSDKLERGSVRFMDLIKDIIKPILVTKYQIKDVKKLQPISNCINYYVNNARLDQNDLKKFLADERISENLHHVNLKNAVNNAMKDDVITYGELFNIYRNLDIALNNNINDDLMKLKNNVAEK